MTEFDRSCAKNQRITDMLVSRNVLHNLCQTMQFYAEHEMDEYLEMFHRYDHEQAATEDGWEETPDDDPKKVKEGYAYRKPNEDYDADDKAEADKEGEEYDEEEYVYSDASDWCDLCYVEDIDATEYPIEVYEFWAVDNWFARKLKEQGEVVEEVLDFIVWGRCCTGQAISMDCVIFRIAAEMEILVGQKNSWVDE